MGNIQGYVEGLHMKQTSTNPSLLWKKWTFALRSTARGDMVVPVLY